MDEEKMWKGFYDKLQEIKMNPPTEHENEIQNSDGGFFEKFGSLLRQKSSIEEDNITSLAPFTENKDDCKENFEDNLSQITEVSETTSDILNTNASFDESYQKDILNEVNEKKVQLVQDAVGMNIEDLYEEVLYEICNNIGYVNGETNKESLIEFAQEIFKISNSKHDIILLEAQKKEPPKIRLNIEIIKAENLLPKDANGLSDPFVTLYLESNSMHKYNTSVKPETLNPIWEEHFSLPIMENPRNEVLTIEVWDFDAAETLKEKVGKFFDVKGVKGLSKLMKEIAVTASTGKHDNELIGKSLIPLKSILSSGLTVWHSLEKGSKHKSRGSILVNLSLSAEKNKHVATKEHSHLLKLLLLYELESSKVAKFWWCGKFSSRAEEIRSQHAIQSGLSSFDCALCQWSVYCTIHEDYPLSFTLFNNLLDVITPVLKCLQTDCEDNLSYWNGVKCILPSCFTIIRKLRLKSCGDQNIVKTLTEVLNILSKIMTNEPPRDFMLFNKSAYNWTECSDTTDLTVSDMIKEAIKVGSREWFDHILDVTKQTSQPNDTNQLGENDLHFLIKIIQMIRSDLQKAVEYFDKHFYQKVRINFSGVLFKFYDVKLFELAEEIVVGVCGNIQKINIADEDLNSCLPDAGEMNMGTTLFELYLVLKRFLAHGKSISSNNTFQIEIFHKWFEPGVTHWLEIAIIKALNRIDKAIELDKLKAVDDTVKYSSSSVDTMAIFYQIKIFWQQLDWPDIEASYTFVAKIVDDICRCCVFYAQKMSRRVESVTKSNNELFVVSTEWCLAINNIDYIRQSLPAFLQELGTDCVLNQLRKYRSNLEVQRCSDTLQNVIDNALDTEKNQIFELIERVVKKMAPSMKRFLEEGAEVSHENSNSMDKLLSYLENSLEILYSYLNEVNFERMLDAIWTELSTIMFDLIQTNLEKRRPPFFFQHLRKTLNIMTSNFKIGNVVTSDYEVLSEVKKMLDLHALETAELIHQYYLDQFNYQKECSKSEYGQLTIKAQFADNDLILNILNARNLISTDSNGSCDSFVKFSFMPTTRYASVPSQKTAVQHKTRFPLYDEHFKIHLNKEQRTTLDGLIIFSIRDKDLFGMTNQYIAECYVTLAVLEELENQQIILELIRPEYTNCDTIRALELRQGDKQAKDFLKKLKSKSL